VIDRVVAALRDGADAVIPTRPVTDTIKRVDAGGRVIETVDRSTLVAVQTPQGFRRDVLFAAHTAGAATRVTDDAGLVEAFGGTVVAVDGADEAFKITRPWDLLLAEAVAAR
jgi:2-C-methyl-D-erythritol 4-phosphate cytidylyltransferase